MPKSLIIANWKCNPSTLAQAKALFAKINQGVARQKKSKIVVCPPPVFLGFFTQKPGKIFLGAQDAFWQEGPFTGESSFNMLKSIGCKYAIVGHSERRKRGESDKEVNNKIKAALSVGIAPVLCVGETFTERENQKTPIVLRKQIQEGLTGVAKGRVGEVIIAYEPVWAIGTGNPCRPEEAMSMKIFIKKFLSQNYGKNISSKTKVLYGGSAKAANAGEYVIEAGMDGLLVGGASLKAKEFLEILKKI